MNRRHGDYESPTQQRAAIVAAFLEAFERPCGCDLREERDGIRCSSCDKRFIVRGAP